MNAQEVSVVIGLVAARYPGAKMLEADQKLTVQAWTMTLDDVPFEAVQPVLARWFKTEKWAPDPSEIRALVTSDLSPVPSEGDVWSRRQAFFRHMRGEEARPEDAFAFKVYASIGKDCGQLPEENLRERVKWAYKSLVEQEQTARNLNIGADIAALDEPEVPRLRVLGS